MKNTKLLYYYWGELIASSAYKALGQLGVNYTVVSPKRISYDFDEAFMKAMKAEIARTECDAVFSFNYFPDLSRVAQEMGIRYIAWVYDAPHLTLESETLANTCNEIAVFDYALYSRYADMGIETVRYLPLPARICFENACQEVNYEHDITFMGTLYDGDKDFYGQIKSLPEYIRGYLDALIKSQKQIYGADIFDSLISDELYFEISKYVKTGLGENYRSCGAEIFKDMLRRRVTMNERKEVLKRLGESFSVDLYCGEKHPELGVRECGFADYEKEMPQIFKSGKINLNITLRSIRTGIPLRVMDILGAGGFCLTNYQPELEEYFENGTDIVWYEDIDDLEAKCRYYLEHEDERRQIAANGQRRVKELFSFERQLEDLLSE